jgi:hypothetical protein
MPPSTNGQCDRPAELIRTAARGSPGGNEPLTGHLDFVDITDLILEDHHRQRQAFARLDGVDSSDVIALGLLWGDLAAFLESHAAAEEAVFYPELLRRADEDGEQTRDALGDHNDIRDAISASAKHQVGTPEWWEAVGKARSANTEHMGEEEDEGLADFRRHSPLSQRHALGILFEAAKTRPVESELDTKDKNPDDFIAEYRRSEQSHGDQG